MAENSVLEHLAWSINSYAESDLFLMFNAYTSYSDGAGGKDHGFIAVSGYVSTFRRWNAFIADWRYALARFDVPYFHMKKFAQSKGPFVLWLKDEPRRIRFLSSLAEIISANVEQSFACIVEFDIFNKVNRRYQLDDAVGVPYSLAGRDCIAHAHEYLRDQHEGELPEVNHVFEDGDEGKGELIRVVMKDGYNSPMFRPSRDRKAKDGSLVRGLVQLQAADFAAYEVRKAFRDDRNEVWPVWKYRKSLAALSRIPGWWGRYGERDLVKMCRTAHIQERASVA